MVVLLGDTAVFPVIGKHMAKDYDVSCDNDFVAVTVSVCLRHSLMRSVRTVSRLLPPLVSPSSVSHSLS